MCGKMVENFARLEQLGQNPLYQSVELNQRYYINTFR